MRNLNMNRLGFLLLASLTGCTLAPNYQRPTLPVSAVWPANAQQLGSKSYNGTDWQAGYSDPRLQMLISSALENNRDLRIATARIAEARAQYGIQKADQWPNLNLTAGRSASLTPASASITGKTLHTQRYDVGVSLVSFELDFWGRVRSLSAAAKANYLATESAQRAFRLSLISDVANAYLSLLEFQERTELAVETEKSRAEMKSMTSRRRELGAAGDLDYLQADGAYQAAVAERANLERQKAAAENLLELLVGKPLSELKELPAGQTMAEQHVATDILINVPSDVLLQRPDVMAAEQKLIAANANIGAARAAFLPRITLTGSIGTASRLMSGLFLPGSQAWSFQPALTLPLFDAGKNIDNLDLAEARKVIAVAEYEKTIQQAFREVADLLTAREKLLEQLTAQTASAESQAQRLKLVEARYQAGVSSYLEVLDAQRDSFAAQQAVVQIKRSLLSTNALLYKATGQGA